MQRKRKDPIVKVMSFNIAHGLGMDGLVDLKRTAEVIEDSCATIIGLQEVDRYFSERSSFADQVDWLSERLGMYAAYGANLDLEADEAERPRRQYGNAILSKYPIKYTENHHLTKVKGLFGNDEQRGVLEAVIEVEGTNISFYNTHLAVKEEEQGVSIGELLEITGKSRFPRIITGDFNAPPTHPHIQYMNQHFSDAFLKMKRGDAYTYPAPYTEELIGQKFEPTVRIDYIFCDKNLPVVQTAFVATAVSDHLPIAADLVLTANRVPPKVPAQAERAKV